MNSLKKVLFTFICFAFTASLIAQISVGARAGITLPNQTFEVDGIDLSLDPNLGLTFAAIVEIGISDAFAIQPELAFVQKGAKLEQENYYGGGTVESKLRVNHIDVPVLAKVKFGTENVGAYVAGGPSFGYAISASEEFDGDKESFDDDDWEDYNRFEVGGLIGGGVGLNLASGGQVFLDLRYMLSLNNLSDFEDVTTRNKGLVISVGFMKSLE